MQIWEIVVLVAGVALVGVSVYLIITLKKMTVTLQKVNKFIDDNESNVTNIVSNVDSVSADAKSLVNKVTTTVEKVSTLQTKTVSDDKTGNAIKATLGIASIVFSVIKAAKSYSEKKKIKKYQRLTKNLK